MINIDFETRSTTDLKKTGVYKYSEDPNTDIWCMAWKLNDTPTELWVAGQPFPSVLDEALAVGIPLRAWNAQFERIIWNTIGVSKYGFPMLGAERFYCTMVDAMAMGLPGKLDSTAKVLQLPYQKDMSGNRLAIQMSKPRRIEEDGTIVWWDTPDRLEKLYTYCVADVDTEHAAFERTRRIDDSERKLYLLDQRINDRGVKVDITLAKQCKGVAIEGIHRANITVSRYTNNEVEAITQVGRMQHWLNEQGCDIPNLKASTLETYLAQGGLSSQVEAVLVARAEAGKSSISKIDRMLIATCSDGALHGMLQFFGASTGRWAGRLVQLHNFPRGTVKDVEHFIPQISAGVQYKHLDLQENPVDIVSSLLRSLLVASEGCDLMAADFSAIEARVLAWMAGQDDLVQMFIDNDNGVGEEVYVIAAKEFGTTRDIGKRIILGAGFGMGWKRFIAMAMEQGQVVIPEEDSKRFISSYRKRYYLIPKLWYAMEVAALKAVKNKGTSFEASHCTFIDKGGFLWMILPSGRPLCYNEPKLVERMAPWGEMKEAVSFSMQDSVIRKWVRRDIYGGLLVENAVQATARDLMAFSMHSVDDQGYPVILTVHDEIISDVPKGFGSFEEYITLMERKPPWAVGCPVKASGWYGRRYRKG